jgi:archaemetzincin
VTTASVLSGPTVRQRRWSSQALACVALYTAGAGFCLLARALVMVDQRSPAAALGASLEPLGSPASSPAAIPVAAPPERDRPVAQHELPVEQSLLTLEARFKRRALFTRLAEHPEAEAGHQRMGEPRPGEWLYHVRERGQTFEEYLEGVRNGLGQGRNRFRHTLHLLPLHTDSAVPRELLDTLRDHTTLFFGVPVEVLPSERVSGRGVFDARRYRYNADALARQLARRVPSESLGVLGMMASDLEGLGLNYVFGLGLLRDRAGVFSTFRYPSPDRRVMLQRVLKVATHELGHLLGLKHCVFYRCLMNGSNSIEEMDRQPLHPCPVCQSKLATALGFDARTRARGLQAFYESHGLLDEARFVAERLTRMPEQQHAAR